MLRMLKYRFKSRTVCEVPSKVESWGTDGGIELLWIRSALAAHVLAVDFESGPGSHPETGSIPVT